MRLSRIVAAGASLSPADRRRLARWHRAVVGAELDAAIDDDGEAMLFAPGDDAVVDYTIQSGFERRTSAVVDGPWTHTHVDDLECCEACVFCVG